MSDLLKVKITFRLLFLGIGYSITGENFHHVKSRILKALEEHKRWFENESDYFEAYNCLNHSNRSYCFNHNRSKSENKEVEILFREVAKHEN